jgi:hypothetical protein
MDQSSTGNLGNTISDSIFSIVNLPERVGLRSLRQSVEASGRVPLVTPQSDRTTQPLDRTKTMETPGSKEVRAEP